MKLSRLSMTSAGVALLMLASCQSDEAVINEAMNPDGTVTFSVSVPGAISRGEPYIADGLTTDHLYYSVYKIDGATATHQFTEEMSAFNGTLTQEVNIQLVKGVKYRVAFFAKNSQAPYSVTDGKMTIDYTAAPEANSDIYDAFYGVAEDIVAGVDVPQTTLLYRPFAQVNVGADDWAIAAKAGMTVENTSLVFSAQVYTQLDMLTGDVDGEATDLEFTATPWPNRYCVTTTRTAPDYLDAAGTTDKYYWMAMNYVLVPADDSTSPVPTVTFKYDGGVAANSSLAVTQVPVRRNYRTNIIGSFFTENVKYDVEIVPGFDGEIPHPYYPPVVATTADVNQVLNDLPDGGTVQLAPGTYTAKSITWPSNKTFTIKGDENTVIDLSANAYGQYSAMPGSSVTLDGVTIKLSNNSYVGLTAHANKAVYEGCTIEGVLFCFGTDNEFRKCTFVQDKIDSYNVWCYGSNCTFTDCTFKSKSKCVLCYNEGSGMLTQTFNNCEFIGENDPDNDDKAGIQVHHCVGHCKQYVNINSCTATGLGTATKSGSMVWSTRKSETESCARITVDGAVVFNDLD